MDLLAFANPLAFASQPAPFRFKSSPPQIAIETVQEPAKSASVGTDGDDVLVDIPDHTIIAAPGSPPVVGTDEGDLILGDLPDYAFAFVEGLVVAGWNPTADEVTMIVNALSGYGVTTTAEIVAAYFANTTPTADADGNIHIVEDVLP